MKKRRRKVIERKPRSTKCLFCTQGITPDYKEHEKLAQFMSERGRIMNKSYTGVCSKHQRVLTTEVKRARFLGLLPFTARI